MTPRRIVTVLVGAAVLLPAAPALATHPVLQGCTEDQDRLVHTDSQVYGGGYGTGVVLTPLGRGYCSMVVRGSGTNDGSRPDVNPDGRRIVVDQPMATGGRGIVVLDDERHRADPLTSGAVDTAARWNPDGSTVLFTRWAADGTSRLMTVVDPGSNGYYGSPRPVAPPQEVPGTEGAVSGSWSPDGTRLVYAVAADVPDSNGNLVAQGSLVRSAADGSGRTELGLQGLDPTWSPDGREIAYSTVTDLGMQPFSPPRRQLAVAAPQRAATPTVLLRTDAATEPAWLPDGQGLLYTARRGGLDGQQLDTDLFAVDRDGLRAGPFRAGDGDQAGASIRPARAARPVAVGGAASGYVALTPRRVLDTRTTRSPVGPGGPRDVIVTGACGGGCVPVPADATAVALTVTIVQATAATDVRVYPAGTGAPEVSNLNAAAGQTVPNAVIVALGRDGAVTLANAAGSVHLLVDVAGYFRPGARAGFATSDPHRILDTRTGLGAAQGRVGPTGSIDLRVTGALPDADGGTVRVPDDATAVVLNVTATGPSASTDVRAYPSPTDGAVPVVSNLNLRPGQTAASLVTVAVGGGGRVRLRNAGGQVHLLADLAGWYAPSAQGRFVPAAPVRVLDTRSGLGAAPLPTGPQEALDLHLGGRRGVPANATAAVLNLTGTGVSASTDVRAYPPGDVPTVSALNLTAGSTRANLAVVRLGQGQDQGAGAVRLRNNAGTVSLVADLAGWFVDG